MIDLSNVIDLTLGSDRVLQIQDAIGTVLWENGYNVNIRAGSNGTVSVNGVTGNYSERVQSGTVLTIEGIADTDYGFEQWSDGVSTNPRTITVTSDLNLTANFEAVAYYNVSISAGNNGSVSVNGTTGNYSQSVLVGTTLTIEGTGSNGYTFIDWSDGSFDNPRTVTITGDTTLTASFESVALLDYFYVEDASGTDNVLKIFKNTYPSEIFKSTDKVNWTSMGTTSASAITAVIPANSKLYLKTTTNQWGAVSTDNCNIVCNELYKVGGNIMSLLYNNRFYEHTTLSESNRFVSLFKNPNSYYHNKLIDASNLILPNNTTNFCYQNMFQNCTALTTAPTLPATTMAESCYSRMFEGCTALTTAPALPATTLAKSCYYYMFSNCSSLTTAPTLPATTIAESCYSGMFNYCTSLTTAPALPATTLAERCYNSMFKNCTLLTTAPALPATTLARTCYDSMFQNCRNLTTAPAISATTLAPYCCQNMFDGCSSLATAPALPATTMAEGCYYSMFRGCTALTTTPALPATILARSCYYYMFYGCSSLTTAPTLSATTLVLECYRGMFQNCSSLNTVTTYAQDISAGNCLTNWLNTVSATGDFYNLGGATYTSGASGIPTGWTEHTSL